MDCSLAEGEILAQIRLVNQCADCGTELQEAYLDITLPLDDEFVLHHQDEGHELSVDMADIQRSDRYQDKDRHGKRIKSARYMKHLYGANVSFTVTCECGEELELSATTDEITASEMEPLV